MGENRQLESSADIAAPVHGIGVLVQVIKALYAMKKPSGYKELASSAGVFPGNASQALSSLRDLGLCRVSGRRGQYEPTERGAEFVRLQSSEKMEDSRSLLKQAILESPHYEAIVAFLRANRNNPRDSLDLALDVERKQAKRWSSVMRSRVGVALRSILEYAGLVTVEGGKIVSSIGLADESVSKKHEKGIYSSILRDKTARPDDYEELAVSQFQVRVHRDMKSVQFLVSMAKEDSMLYTWLRHLQDELKEAAQSDSKTKEDREEQQ